MRGRNIDPMDQIRRKEKISHLKLIVPAVLIVFGMFFCDYISTTNFIEIKSYSISSISKYILSLTFLFFGWATLIALAHVIRLSYIYFTIRKYVNIEIHYILFHQIIRRMAIAIFWIMFTTYMVDWGSSKSNLINSFYYSTLDMKDDGIWASILWLIWMVSFFGLNIFASSYWLALMGFFTDDDFIVEDQEV